LTPKGAAPATGRPGLRVERSLWRAGHEWVAGMDEVGRGAWAGPLSVGVAVVHPGIGLRSMPRWLRDSKALPEDRREAVYGLVAAWCADAAVGHASADECDRFGMTLAWRLAAHRALGALELVPDAVVIDGPHDLLRGRARARAAAGAVGDVAGVLQALEGLAGPEDREEEDPPRAADREATRREGESVAGGPPSDRVGGAGEPVADARANATVALAVVPREVPDLPVAPVPDTVLTVVDADATCAAVAAASVLAKVVRDRAMRAEAEHFPPYGFDRNKGYPSTRHKIALRGYGLSAIHRRTWAYVAGLPFG
jgi:ribonuclease HII